MKFSEAKEHLYIDGSLRDIYVLEATPDALEAFYEYVRPMVSDENFFIDGDASSLPTHYVEAVAIKEEASVLLTIPIGDGDVCCHFFDSRELELDISPKDYQNEESWNALSAFLQGLANAMQREVFITPENSQEDVLIRFTLQS